MPNCLLMGRKRPSTPDRSPGVVELPDLDEMFIEAVEQPGVDAHRAEILAEGLPMRAAPADRAMVDADHAIAPDVGDGLAGHAHVVRRIISDALGGPATERAVAVRDPCRRSRHLDPHGAAMTASLNSHGDL